MKYILICLILVCSFAQAKEIKKAEKKGQVAAIEEAIRKSILQDLRINVEIKSDSSVCGSEPGDIVMAEVMLKKAARDEKGNLKDRWEEVESYSAPLKEFEKMGAKAFIKDGQCQE